MPKGEEPLAFYANQNLITLDEADPPPPREEPARILRARDVLGRGEHLKNYLIELRAMVGGAQEELQALEDLSRWPDLLQGLGAAEPAGKLLNMWFSSVENAPSNKIPVLTALVNKHTQEQQNLNTVRYFPVTEFI